MASSKLTKAAEADLQDMEMDMSPMIDMVFLLLIFFMVNAVIIDYRKDVNVTIPIASKANPPKDASGRVIINIYNDEVFEEKGFRFADEDSGALDEEGITELVRRIRERNEPAGIKTRIHIRGDKDVDVSFTKRAVKAAGEGGVADVIFSTYNNPN
ncbi:hypothetical protein BH23VER1_BH23VER1_35350 [soil metagenome]